MLHKDKAKEDMGRKMLGMALLDLKEAMAKLRLNQVMVKLRPKLSQAMVRLKPKVDMVKLSQAMANLRAVQPCQDMVKVSQAMARLRLKVVKLRVDTAVKAN